MILNCVSDSIFNWFSDELDTDIGDYGLDFAMDINCRKKSHVSLYGTLGNETSHLELGGILGGDKVVPLFKFNTKSILFHFNEKDCYLIERAIYNIEKELLNFESQLQHFFSLNINLGNSHMTFVVNHKNVDDTIDISINLFLIKLFVIKLGVDNNDEWFTKISTYIGKIVLAGFEFYKKTFSAELKAILFKSKLFYFTLNILFKNDKFSFVLWLGFHIIIMVVEISKKGEFVVNFLGRNKGNMLKNFYVPIFKSNISEKKVPIKFKEISEKTIVKPLDNNI